MIDINALQPLFDKFASVWSDITSRLTGMKVEVSSPGLNVVTADQVQQHLGEQCALAATLLERPIPGLTLLAMPFPLASVIPEKIISPDSEALPEALSELHIGALRELISQVWAAAGESFAAESPAGFEVGDTEVTVDSPANFYKKNPALAVAQEFLAAQYQVGEGEILFNVVQLIPADFIEKTVSAEAAPAPKPAKPAPPAEKPAPKKSAPAAAPSKPVAKAQPRPVEKVQKALSSLDIPKVQPGSVKNKQRVTPNPPQNLRSPESVKRNMDTLLDIPVDLRVELGTAKMGAGDIVRIGPGSVVELDTMNGHPVRVLANGQLIAMGLVVSVGDKFGIKIVELVAPQKRIFEM